jgi:hypothetical protein
VPHRRGAPPANRRASGVRRRVTKEPSRTSGQNPGWISGLGLLGPIEPGPMGCFRPTDFRRHADVIRFVKSFSDLIKVFINGL